MSGPERLTPDQYEKLGVFYLGRPWSLERREPEDGLLLYDSKDLTTHAVCVGMTGSGKTGLCVSLLEEAAIDGVPALIIDPKGDLGNLLLTFPELRAADFRPWIHEDEARRKGLDPEQYAAAEAEQWRRGLASWGQSGERIRRLRDAAEFAIYTPGSTAGLPVSVLSSFAAPPEPLRADEELLGERVGIAVTSLLGLLGLRGDPIRSREHILLSTIFHDAWRQGQDLDIEGMIRRTQTPGVERIGVLDVETFYPARERFELAMALNNLLAAPGFRNWMSGEPLDVGRLLYTAEGKPRMAILSIAHLSEAERMFFVGLLLNQTLGWMRARPGTTTLRALLYMDELFGYLPPSAEPPSKRPLLTLLKQARAYGLGIVLATQNPVDLDYKALSNAGTWFLGRLQTERDKLRVLEGLEGAGAGGGFDPEKMERILAGLDSRVFLMHNVHDQAPSIFHSRWAMSYLRGPLTREQIRQLMQDRPAAVAAAPPPAARVAPHEAPRAAPAATARPVLAPGVRERFLPWRGAPGSRASYEPCVLGLGRVQFVDRSTKRVRHVEEIALLHPLDGDATEIDWTSAGPLGLDPAELEPEPEPGAAFRPLPAAASRKASYDRWERALADALYRNSSCELLWSPRWKIGSEPGESEGDFRVRLRDASREDRDRQVDALRRKHAARAGRLEERLRRARLAVDREQSQVSSRKLQTAISMGTTVLSMLLGRKATSARALGRATTAARDIGRTVRERTDVERARENVAALEQQLAELTGELERAVDEFEAASDPLAEELETVALRPRRADVDVRGVALAWRPG